MTRIIKLLLIFLFSFSGLSYSQQNPQQNEYVPGASYSIELRSPAIAENSSEVSVTVIARGLDKPQRYIRNLKIFACKQIIQPIVNANFVGPVQVYRTRIKMGVSGQLIAVATLNTGERLIAGNRTRVTRGGCGGGSFASNPNRLKGGTSSAITPDRRSGTWVRSRLPVNSARLVNSSGQHLLINSVKANIKINGFRARVLLDIEFYNSTSWNREARFQLRLPQNASPYYVAFGDVVLNDERNKAVRLPSANAGFTHKELKFGLTPPLTNLKEAIMVPRKKARVAYDTITSRGLDPALVEWQGSGVYSVQVFPLLPHRDHRVVLAYDLDLHQDPDTGNYEFDFNALSGNGLTHVYLDMDETTASKIVSLKPQIGRRIFSQSKKVFHLRAGENLKIEFSGSKTYHLRGHDLKTGDYFMVRSQPNIKVEKSSSQHSKAMIMLDTSAFPGRRDFEAYVDLVLALLEKNKNEIREFSVMYFDVGTRWWKPGFIQNTLNSRRELRNALYQIKLAGATDLHRAIQQAVSPHWLKKSDANVSWDIFMFTDGRPTWGVRNPKKLLQAFSSKHITKVFAYTSERAVGNRDLLSYLVSAHHGALYHFKPFISYKDALRSNLVTAHKKRRWRVIAASADNGIDVTLQNTNTYYVPGMPITVLGRGSNVKHVTLKLSSKGKIMYHRIHLPGGSIPSDMVSRTFGEAVVRRMENAGIDKYEIVKAYAGHFRVPRATMSLLMLESGRDYKRFSIQQAVDYSDTVVKNPISAILEKSYPMSSLLVDQSIAPADSGAEIKDILRSFTVCILPNAQKNLFTHLMQQMGELPKQKAYLMSRRAMNIQEPKNLNRDILFRQKQYEKYLAIGQGKAAVRALSSLADNPKIKAVTWFRMAKKLLKQNNASDVYYSLRNFNLNAKAIPLMRKAAAKSDALILANSLKKLEKMIQELKLR